MAQRCWTGNADVTVWGSDAWAEAVNAPATCMLPLGHTGAHRWILDEMVTITFEEYEGAP